MGVAHGHRGDQIAVEQARPGKREPIAADYARLARLRQRRRERGNLAGLLAAMPCHRAGQCVEQEILALLAGALGNVLVPEGGGELRQRLRRLLWHRLLLDGIRGAGCDRTMAEP